MEGMIVDAVTKVSNALNKKRGNTITIPREHVETVMCAEVLMVEQLEKWQNSKLEPK